LPMYVLRTIEMGIEKSVEEEVLGGGSTDDEEREERFSAARTEAARLRG